MAVEQELSNLAHCIDEYGKDDRMTILEKYNNFNKDSIVAYNVGLHLDVFHRHSASLRTKQYFIPSLLIINMILVLIGNIVLVEVRLQGNFIMLCRTGANNKGVNVVMLLCIGSLMLIKEFLKGLFVIILPIILML